MFKINDQLVLLCAIILYLQYFYVMILITYPALFGSAECRDSPSGSVILVSDLASSYCEWWLLQIMPLWWYLTVLNSAWCIKNIPLNISVQLGGARLFYWMDNDSIKYPWLFQQNFNIHSSYSYLQIFS